MRKPAVNVKRNEIDGLSVFSSDEYPSMAGVWVSLEDFNFIDEGGELTFSRTIYTEDDVDPDKVDNESVDKFCCDLVKHILETAKVLGRC